MDKGRLLEYYGKYVNLFTCKMQYIAIFAMSSNSNNLCRNTKEILSLGSEICQLSHFDLQATENYIIRSIAKGESKNAKSD